MLNGLSDMDCLKDLATYDLATASNNSSKSSAYKPLVDGNYAGA